MIAWLEPRNIGELKISNARRAGATPKMIFVFHSDTIIRMHEKALYVKFRCPMDGFIVSLGPKHARQNQENSIRDVTDECKRKQLFPEVHAH